MKISIDRKKVEAVRHMELLGIYPETIQQFEKYNLVSVSEPPLGAFFLRAVMILSLLRTIEAKHDALIYMIIRAYYKELDKLDSYLFVGDYREEWAYDSQGFANGEAFAYVNGYVRPLWLGIWHYWN